MSPEPIRFVRSRGRPLRLCVVSLAFCVLGVGLVASGTPTGWLSLAAAPFALFFGFQAVRPPRLDPAAAGFPASGALARPQRLEHRDCGEFRVFRSPGGRGSEAVAVEWAHRPAGWAADVNRRRYGFSETLVNTFGAPTQEIVDELNARRTAAKG